MKIVILGGGAAGLNSVNNLIEQNNDLQESKSLEIIIVNSEKEYPYYRPFLSKCCGLNMSISSFYLQIPKWYDDHKIKLLKNTKPTSIDFKKNSVMLNNGETLAYDKLVLATGAHGFKLPNIDYKIPGIFQLNSYSDVEKITKYVKDNNVEKALVVGGGILGCESANAMTRFKAKTKVVEMMGQIMPRMLSKNAASHLAKIIESFNIEIITSDYTTKIEKQNNGKFLVVLKSQKEFIVDIVVINVGVRPNIEFLQNTGIEIDRGVVCNKYLETSIKDVYVAGDILQYEKRPTIMLWEPALEQAKIVAHNILDSQKPIPYDFDRNFVVTYNSFGINLNSLGNPENICPDCKEIIISRKINTKEAKVFIIHCQEKIVFAASFNDSMATQIIRKLPQNGYLLTLFDDYINSYK